MHGTEKSASTTVSPELSAEGNKKNKAEIENKKNDRNNVPEKTAAPISFSPDVEFPTKVAYFDVINDVAGNRSEWRIRLKKGSIVAIYKAENKDWWLGRSSDEIGWVPPKDISPITNESREKRNDIAVATASVSNRRLRPRREWENDKFIYSEDAVTQLSDFSFSQYKVFENHDCKVAAFFIQVSGGKKNKSWIVAKSINDFNKLRVVWEEDFGSSMVPVESPSIRFADCSQENWDTFRISATKKFLEEVKLFPALKESQDFKHFLLTDKIDHLSGVIKKEDVKRYMLKWVQTSCEPIWTFPLMAIPSTAENSASGESSKEISKSRKLPLYFPLANGQNMEKGMLKVTVPGLKLKDDFWKLNSNRPKVRRSQIFAEISALAAVMRQESFLEVGTKGWSNEDGMKLRLLNQSGAASALQRRNERRLYIKYYNSDTQEATTLLQRGSMSQIKVTTRYSLEKVIYGRIQSIYRDDEQAYAITYKNKKRNELENNPAGVSGSSIRSPPKSPSAGRKSFHQISQHGGGTRSPTLKPAFGGTPGTHSHHFHRGSTPGKSHYLRETPGHHGSVHHWGTPGHHGKIYGVSPTSISQHYGISPGSHAHHYHHYMKNSFFNLDSMSYRLEHIHSLNRSTHGNSPTAPAGRQATVDKCQYMSQRPGESMKPLPAQLAAFEELTMEKLQHWINIYWPAMGAANLYYRLKEIESFLGKRRVRCSQVMRLLELARAPEERVMIAIMSCARLTDAIEAKELGLWNALNLDDLNMERARLCGHALSAEALAEDAARGCRRAAREVYADVLDARKALACISSATLNVRNGVIAPSEFDKLKERLGAAAERAHEDYRDAIRDAKPASEFAAEAMHWMEIARTNYETLISLGSRVYDRVGVVHSDDEDEGSPTHDQALQQKKHELAMVQEGIEIAMQIVQNAHELALRAAENARRDMQSALEEVIKAERILKMVELEERRARNECEIVDGNPPDEDLPDGCRYAIWSAEMRKNTEMNLANFVKDAKYRINKPKQIFKGPNDVLMMVMLMSKVQLVRDMKKLREDKAEEEKRAEQAKNVEASKILKKVESDPKESEKDKGDEAGKERGQVTDEKNANEVLESINESSFRNHNSNSSIESFLSKENKSHSEEDSDSSDSISTSLSSCSSLEDSTETTNRTGNEKAFRQLKKSKKKKNKEFVGLQKQHAAMRTKLIKDTFGSSKKKIARKQTVGMVADKILTPVHDREKDTGNSRSPHPLPPQGEKISHNIWNSDHEEETKS